MAEKIIAKQVRGNRLVANVLEATIVELARVGFENISVESVAERDRFFDEWGGAYWGTNGMKDRPGYSFITATEGLGLRELATAALAKAGFPPPPEDAWERREEI